MIDEIAGNDFRRDALRCVLAALLIGIGVNVAVAWGSRNLAEVTFNGIDDIVWERPWQPSLITRQDWCPSPGDWQFADLVEFESQSTAPLVWRNTDSLSRHRGWGPVGLEATGSDHQLITRKGTLRWLELKRDIGDRWLSQNPECGFDHRPLPYGVFCELDRVVSRREVRDTQGPEWTKPYWWASSVDLESGEFARAEVASGWPVRSLRSQYSVRDLFHIPSAYDGLSSGERR